MIGGDVEGGEQAGRRGRSSRLPATRAEIGDGREFPDRERAPRILPDVGQDQLNPIRFRRHIEERQMLLLSAHPALTHDEKAGDLFRDLRPKVLIHHCQNEVEPGGHSGRRPDRTVIDKDPILFHSDIRKTGPEAGRLDPVRCRASPIKKPGFSENERPIAK